MIPKKENYPCAFCGTEYAGGSVVLNSGLREDVNICLKCISVALRLFAEEIMNGSIKLPTTSTTYDAASEPLASSEPSPAPESEPEDARPPSN